MLTYVGEHPLSILATITPVENSLQDSAAVFWGELGEALSERSQPFAFVGITADRGVCPGLDHMVPRKRSSP